MPRSSEDIRVLDRTDASASAVLAREMDAFNMAAIGVRDARDLAALVRDEHGALVGGADGGTRGGTCWSEHLSVRTADRRHGVGGRAARCRRGGGPAPRLHHGGELAADRSADVVHGTTTWNRSRPSASTATTVKRPRPVHR